MKPIADSVARQTNAVNELKPSWFTTQGWSSSDGHFPTSRNRATVYTAIVHGATGILYFIFDGSTARNVNVVGFRQEIPARYPEQVVTWEASDQIQQEGEEFWDSVVALNAELAFLEPVLLHPTSTEP